MSWKKKKKEEVVRGQKTYRRIEKKYKEQDNNSVNAEAAFTQIIFCLCNNITVMFAVFILKMYEIAQLLLLEMYFNTGKNKQRQ